MLLNFQMMILIMKNKIKQKKFMFGYLVINLKKKDHYQIIIHLLFVQKF